MAAAKRSRSLARSIPLGWADENAVRSPGPQPGQATPNLPGSPSAGIHLPGADVGPEPTGSARLTGFRPLRIAEALGLVLAVVVSMVLLLDSPGPEDVARDYLEAIVTGDAATVRAHLAPSSTASDIALTDEVLQQAEDRIRSYSIDSVQIRQGQADLEVTLRGGVGIASISLTLHSSTAGPFSPVSWHLAPVRLPELDLVIPAGATEILLNGVRIDLSEMPATPRGAGNPRNLALSMLPGTYRIELPDRGELLETADMSRSVPVRFGQWRSAFTIVMYELTEAGQQAARQAIRTELAACADSDSARPPGCPFGVDLEVTADGAGVAGAETREPVRGRWAITRMPELVHEHTLTPGWIFVGSEGQAQFTTTVTDPATGEDTEEVHVVALDLFAVVHTPGGEDIEVWMRERDCGFMVAYDAAAGTEVEVPAGYCG